MAASTFISKVWTFLILFSVFFSSCSNEAKQVEKAKQIKKGMTKQEVNRIMGEPDKKDIVKSYPPYTERFYYYISPPVFSDDIIIWFDSTGYVRQVSLPKGTEK